MKKHELFISYARLDKSSSIVKEFLEKKGYKVWIDKEFIKPGDLDFVKDLYDHIVRSDVIISILSKTSQHRRWVSKELTFATSNDKDIFFLHIDGSEITEKISFLAGSSQIINAEDDLEAGCEQLCKQLKRFFSEQTNRERGTEVISGNVPAPSLEGKIVESAECFMPFADHSNETLSPYYSDLGLDPDSEQFIQYHEIYGSPEPHKEEYTEGRNLFCSYENWTPDISSYVDNYEERKNREKIISLQAGYDPDISISRLLLAKAAEIKNPMSRMGSKLYLIFGEEEYYEQRILRPFILTDPDLKNRFAERLSVRGNNNGLDHEPWALCGGGIWIVTSDGYLMVSYRTNVAEEKGKLSYSSSGGFDRRITRNGEQIDGTPINNMIEEIQEEIGIGREQLEENQNQITLISLGIDINRFLIQFSYYWKSPYSREDIRKFRKTGDTLSIDEQVLFFIPFEKGALSSFLNRYEFEPGAAFSLLRIIQKYF